MELEYGNLKEIVKNAVDKTLRDYSKEFHHSDT